MSKPIWVLESSPDGGRTWAIVQMNNAFYRTEIKAKNKSEHQTKWHRDGISKAAKQYGWIFRAVEYRPVET